MKRTEEPGIEHLQLTLEKLRTMKSEINDLIYDVELEIAHCTLRDYSAPIDDEWKAEIQICRFGNVSGVIRATRKIRELHGMSLACAYDLAKSYELILSHDHAIRGGEFSMEFACNQTMHRGKKS